MKKRTLKSLSLNKKSISNFSTNVILGQGPKTVTPDCTIRFTYDVLCLRFTHDNDCFRPSVYDCDITSGLHTGDFC